MAEHKLQFEALIPAPREQVFDYLAEPANLSRLWGMRWKCTQPGDDLSQPNGVGSIREVRAGDFTYRDAVRTFDRPALIEHHMESGVPVTNRLAARIAFFDVLEGTRVQYTISYSSKVDATGAMMGATLELAWTVGIQRIVKAFSA
jgi:uncharacterized protein YndB with AHSA1/START domain